MKFTTADKAVRFKALHDGPAFIIPNPWDIGTARILVGMGFQALATSSAAAEASLGRRDGQLSRSEAIAHAKTLADGADVPVSADLENGFGSRPEDVAETVRLAAAAGLAGCTIEDTTRDPLHPLFDFNLAAERIAAAVTVVQSLDRPFMLTARAHGLLFNPDSLDEVVQRLQAFERAGADVLFAPGLANLDAVRTVCAAVRKPVNFMAGFPGKSFPVPDLTAAGVKRISLATSLYRAAMTGFLEAIKEIRSAGEFSFLDRSVTTAELIKLMDA